jgi:hypothetical protein
MNRASRFWIPDQVLDGEKENLDPGSGPGWREGEPGSPDQVRDGEREKPPPVFTPVHCLHKVAVPAACFGSH